MVAVPARPWRPFLAPAVFLAAATLAVVGIRVLSPHHHAQVAQQATRSHHARAAATVAGPRYYRVRAGDTLAAIAARTKTPVTRLRRLNPAVQPTALFIGQRLRLR